MWELTFSKIPDSFSSRSDFFYTLKCEEPVYLNKESINDIKKKITQGCYHEGWGNGKIAEYVVISGPEGSYNLIFTTYGGDEATEQLKKQKISSLSLGYSNPFGEQVSCNYDW